MFEKLKNIFNKTPEGMINRDCPFCGSSSFKVLIEVDPDIFIHHNPTLDVEAIKETGLYNLDHIPLVRCKSCGFVYTKYLLDENWTGIFWEKTFIVSKSKEKIYTNKKKLELANLWYPLFQYIIRRDFQENKTYNVLDFGSGWGDFLQMAKCEGVDCYGVEIDKQKTAHAREKGLFITDSINGLPDNIKFDFLILNQCVEHLPDPVEVLKNISEKLAEDCAGIFAVPNYSEKILKEKIKKAKNGELADKNMITWDHVNYFSPGLVWDFLDFLGFEIFDPKDGSVIQKKSFNTTACYFQFKRKGGQ